MSIIVCLILICMSPLIELRCSCVHLALKIEFHCCVFNFYYHVTLSSITYLFWIFGKLRKHCYLLPCSQNQCLYTLSHHSSAVLSTDCLEGQQRNYQISALCPWVHFTLEDLYSSHRINGEGLRLCVVSSSNQTKQRISRFIECFISSSWIVQMYYKRYFPSPRRLAISS